MGLPTQSRPREGRPRRRQDSSVIHDCIPFDRNTSTRKITPFWSGDVWKVIYCLKKYRPDLNCHTIATSPTGLGLITGLNPESTTLDDKYYEIVSEFLDMTYDDVAKDFKRSLNIIDNDWSIIKKHLT